MTKKRASLFLALLFAGINVIIFSLGLVWPEAWEKLSRTDLFAPDQVSEESENALRVKRVIDGDTIEMGSGEKVRYIGVNTPESVDPRKGVECFGKEASQFNRELVEGKVVRLERDISDRDRYGRLLRFVYLEDGTFVNELLVREGYASVSTYPPDVTKKNFFLSAENEARKAEKGLWNKATCDGKK